MSEDLSANLLNEQQINALAEQRVLAVLDQTDWFDGIEQKVIKYAQDRIVSRFSNISTVPDLIDTVENSVERLFDQGRIPDISNFVTSNKINSAIDASVKKFINAAIENLVVDTAWLSKIEELVNKSMSDKLSKRLQMIDINSLLVSTIESGIDRWQDRLRQNFRTNGISDQASDIELTVMQGVVVVERDFVAKNIQVEQDLIINNLVVSGAINTDNRSWNELKDVISQQVLTATTEQWRQDLVDQVVAQSRTAGINFDSVMVDGDPLIENKTLAAAVVDSNLQSIGTLKTLKVAGAANFGQTMQVAGRRVGINTQDPEMALAVWDEEVSIIAGKLSKQQAFIGTARLQNLAIGVNRTPQIEIDVDGLTTIKQLRVGRHRISHAGTVPGHSGTRGDLVLNSDPKPGTPFAWVCLGSFQWQSLHSAQ